MAPRRLKPPGSRYPPGAASSNYKPTGLDFETLFAFGTIAYGCAEFGELVTAVNRINAAGASFQTYYDTFLALAQRTRTLADRELAAGHNASARSAYLRASTYYDMCLYFIPRHHRTGPGGRRVRGLPILLAAG